MNRLPIVILLLFIFSCSSSGKITNETKCSKLYKNNFKNIANREYKTISKNDTIVFNELRFECLHSALLTHKVMFDKFGKWTETVYPSNQNKPLLLWENVDLFSNGKKFNVYTNGIEARNYTYASIMIFNENDKDLLSSESNERETLKNYFTNLIKNNDENEIEFYEPFWKTIAPERWELVKKNLNSR